VRLGTVYSFACLGPLSIFQLPFFRAASTWDLERRGPNLSCLVLLLAGKKKQPVPEWAPKRAAGLITQERLVSKLSADAACFVHFAIGAFRNNSVAAA
jgi:hypothetical protein